MIKDDLTYRIIGCAMKVHNALGRGFQDVIYQRSLGIEMHRADLSYGREVNVQKFDDCHSAGSKRADFIVGNRVAVELKALTALENVHIAQARILVVAYGYDVGLLINFRAERLDYIQIFNGPRSSQNAKHSNSSLPKRWKIE